MNALDAILVELQKRYPNGTAETGAWAELAEEFGVSRELVRQIASNLGYKRVRKVRMVRVCASCGKCGLVPGSKLYCADCVKIPLSCDECGKIRYEYVDWVLRRFDPEYNAQRAAKGQQTYLGHSFCSKQCSWRYRGKHYGWGNPNHPHNAHKGEHGRVAEYRTGCRCDKCVAAMSTYNKMRYADPARRERILARRKAAYARKKAERAAARA